LNLIRTKQKTSGTLGAQMSTTSPIQRYTQLDLKDASTIQVRSWPESGANSQRWSLRHLNSKEI